MKKLGYLDELQLLKRGNVFKHCLFTLAGLLLFNTLLYAAGIEWATGKWAELTMILFTIILCNIEFICYDIYPLAERKKKLLIYFCGLFGLVEIIACIYDLLTEKTGIIVDGKVVSSALAVIHGIMFASVFLAYIIKTKHNVQHEKEEE